ncbi:MAG: hypothetical protein HY360_04690 [Verrucomicrobia bacterium]|nr:hypothetical protein [Verrucomicrobiota bacterium]
MPIPIKMIRSFFSHRLVWCLLLVTGVYAPHPGNAADGKFSSHPPLRTAPPSAPRPMGKGTSSFVDPARGNDANQGTEPSPWKTIRHALTRLKAGDTLYLRGGAFYENVSISLSGKKEAPITIRSYPGEQAVIDGGWREFFESPEQAWEPVPQGVPGEYRSTRFYPNVRDVIGAFGDSMVGLQTYWHAVDLRATNELVISEGERGVKPIYCGPGVWYNREDGRIHVRLANTHLDWPGVPNYQGETDPRKLPLVLAPFRSVPLFIDQASHVSFQDLVIRGGGFDTVIMQQGIGIEFDNVTVHCGTYGLRAWNTGPFRFHNSALYGNIPPWGSRTETSLMTRSADSGARDIARLTGHALLVVEGGEESSVYAWPFNHDWEISHSEFTDGHDGIYLGGVSVRFHHNLLDNCHDDGIYLSPVHPYAPQDIRITQNRITRCLTALASGGLHPPRGKVHICRNLIDLTGSVNYHRPSEKEPSPKPSYGNPIGDHGSPLWAPMFICQNTFILTSSRIMDAGALSDTSVERPRWVFNNLFVYLDDLPLIYRLMPPSPKYDVLKNDIRVDGNLYWTMKQTPPPKTDFLDAFRASKPFEESKTKYAPGLEASSLVADPQFLKFDPPNQSDFRLGKTSPAAGKGVILPAECEDPLRPSDGRRPDIGAIPAGGETFKAGRLGRIDGGTSTSSLPSPELKR